MLHRQPQLSRLLALQGAKTHRMTFFVCVCGPCGFVLLWSENIRGWFSGSAHLSPKIECLENVHTRTLGLFGLYTVFYSVFLDRYLEFLCRGFTTQNVHRIYTVLTSREGTEECWGVCYPLTRIFPSKQSIYHITRYCSALTSLSLCRLCLMMTLHVCITIQGCKLSITPQFPLFECGI